MFHIETHGCRLPVTRLPAFRICHPGRHTFRRIARDTYASAVPWRKSNGLRYGAGSGDRIRDLYLGKVALYQLSYSRVLRAGGLAGRVTSPSEPHVGSEHRSHPRVGLARPPALETIPSC